MYRNLSRASNQALGLGQYAIEFLAAGEPGEKTLRQVELFHADSVACAAAALGLGLSAPTLLRQEALERSASESPGGACFGSSVQVAPEKAVLANCSAVRELDANGTNFGHNPRTGYTRGEFGHNDFYPVAVTAARLAGADGKTLLRAMVCLDEIRGRLAECFALKDHKIDHVMHGGIASAAVYGAMLGASAEQIESAIGLLVSHYVPFRAIRAGKQLSDSKGASAAITAEMAIVSMQRAMRGFRGPADVFRNPQALFCLFEPPAEPDSSPFDLELAFAGDDFAINDMHFKLGVYEHQSAGAIQAMIDLLASHRELLESPDGIRKIRITIYEPAFGIIGDPAKRNPQTRQSADHSMVYIIATLLRKAIEAGASGWTRLMLTPADYLGEALTNPQTRRWIDLIEFSHGGPDYDSRYPDGIPTTVEIEHAEAGELSSGLVMYPQGHARCPGDSLNELLSRKIAAFAAIGGLDPSALSDRLSNLGDKTPEQVADLYNFAINLPDEIRDEAAGADA